MLSYGVYALAHGAAMMVWLCGGAECESAFVTHIRQSGGTALFSLGLLALSMRQGMSRLPGILWTFFLANALMALVNLLVHRFVRAVPWHWSLVVFYLVWSTGFAFCATRASAASNADADVGAPPAWQRWLATSLAVMTLLETARRRRLANLLQ